MGRAGCLRSTARSKLFLVQCSHAAIISPASSRFENPADTMSCHQHLAGARSPPRNERKRSRCRHQLVRQCATWLPENGWTRVDPTSAVAPGRASLDLTSFLETSIASERMGTRRNALIAQLFRSGVFTNVRFIWQTLSYEWDTRLLAFDADVQDVLLTSMGIGSRGPVFLVTQILLVAIALLAIYFAWMQLRTRSRVDRVKALYEHFCRKTARLGVPRHPCEGPLDFAGRAAQSLPNESNRIRQIADTYILLRYAPQPAPEMLDRFAKEVNTFGGRS